MIYLLDTNTCIAYINRLGAYDLQIAAIALANHLILVTHNVNEFSRVEGLTIEDWEV
jgi:tRNA(fMet)-specific endonuclease VapC